jgi:hypothetical protein
MEDAGKVIRSAQRKSIPRFWRFFKYICNFLCMMDWVTTMDKPETLFGAVQGVVLAVEAGANDAVRRGCRCGPDCLLRQSRVCAMLAG